MTKEWQGYSPNPRLSLWMRSGKKTPGSLKLYNPYSFKGKLWKYGVAALEAVGAGRWLVKSAGFERSRKLEEIAGHINEHFGSAEASIAFFEGESGYQRKLTAQVTSTGALPVYVKIGVGGNERRLVRREYDVLNLLSGSGPPGISFPIVSEVQEAGGLTLLYQSAPEGRHRSKGVSIDEADLQALMGLSSVRQRRVQITDVLHDLNCDHLVGRATGADAETKKSLQRAADLVHRTFSKNGVGVSLGHGDYAPWNCLTLGDGKQFLFDWEYGSDSMPCLFDACHCLTMPAKLVLYEAPEQIARRLLNISSHPVLGRLIDHLQIDREEAQGYVLVYLMSILARSRRTDGGIDPYFSALLHSYLELLDRAMTRMKILMIAYACEPGKGSEPGVGWNVAQSVAQRHDVWVITRANNRQAIETALAGKPNPMLRFAYVDLPKWLRFWKRGGRGIRTYYYLWQFAAYITARRLGKGIKFDVAHHVTFVQDWSFTCLALLPYPFVWGPVGSNGVKPKVLIQDLGAYLVDRAKYAAKYFFRLADPMMWLSSYRANIIVGIDRFVIARPPFSLFSMQKTYTCPAIGVEETFLRLRADPINQGSLNVMSAGRLIDIKGFDLGIRAFAHLIERQPNAHFTIIGSGPEKKNLADLASGLSVSNNMKFVDWMPREEYLKVLSTADVFLFPSTEGGGMVVLEAMASAIPVVCLKSGGAGEMVDNRCGVVVEVSQRNEVVRSLGGALVALAEGRQKLAALGMAAQQRVSARYMWSGKAATYSNWYASCIESKTQ